MTLQILNAVFLCRKILDAVRESSGKKRGGVWPILFLAVVVDDDDATIAENKTFVCLAFFPYFSAVLYLHQ